METFSQLSPGFIRGVRPYDPEADRTFGEALTRIGSGLVSLPSDVMSADTGWRRAAAAAEEQARAVDLVTSSNAIREDWFSNAIDRVKKASGVDLTRPSLAVTMDQSDLDYGHAFEKGTKTRDELEAEFFRQAKELAARYPELSDITVDRLQSDLIGRAQSAEKVQQSVWQDPSINPWIKGAGTFWGGFKGAVEAGDPATLVSVFMPAGGKGATFVERLWSSFLTQATVGGVTTAASQPAVQAWREEAGLPSGFKEAALNTAFGALVGGAGGAAVHAGGEAVGAGWRAARDLAARGVHVTPDMESAFRWAGEIDSANETMRAARPETTPEHAGETILMDGLAATSEPSAPLPLVDVAIPPGVTDTLARRLLDGASDLGDALARLRSTPAEMADVVLRREQPETMGRLDAFRRQSEINAAAIAEIDRRLATPEMSAIRRAFIQAENVASDADRLAKAAEIATTASEKDRLSSRASELAAKAKAEVDKLDRRAVEELDRLEAEVRSRRSGQEATRRALAQMEAAMAEQRAALAAEFAQGGDFRAIAKEADPAPPEPVTQPMSEADKLRKQAEDIIIGSLYSDDPKARDVDRAMAADLKRQADELDRKANKPRDPKAAIKSALASPDPKIRDVGRIATLDLAAQRRVVTGELQASHAAAVAATTGDPALQAAALAAIDAAKPRTVAEARKIASDVVSAENAVASSSAMLGADFGPKIEATPATFAAAFEEGRRLGTGEIVGALSHPGLGPIDAPIGNKRGGLIHIEKKHPEVPIAHLPEIIARSEIVERTARKAVLFDGATESIIRLRWEDGYGGPAIEKRWLVTAYEKKGRPEAVTSRAPDEAATGSFAAPAKENIRPASSDIKDAVPMLRDDGTVEIVSRADIEKVAAREEWMGDVINACKS